MRENDSGPAPGEALGQSDAFLTFQERLSQVARVNRPVLIVGERGTGKELAAQRLHFLSGRWEEPLVALNCAALPATLIESELFGYEPGAFTGATRRRAGRFEAAHGGTLFLDELGNIPLQVQEKILRVVEYGGFERVGGAEAVRVDVRLVGATNADLPALVASGRFMADLLDRISFEVLHVPPLRDRAGDILELANHFAARMAMELGMDAAPAFADEAIDALLAHPWRGNVRELKNVVERAVFRSEGAEIRAFVFDPFNAGRAPTPPPAAPAARETLAAAEAPASDLKTAVAALERRMLRAALDSARHNQRSAARRLGLTYHQFRGLYRKHREALEGE